jgi:hypothetical protein
MEIDGISCELGLRYSKVLQTNFSHIKIQSLRANNQDGSYMKLDHNSLLQHASKFIIH